MIVVTDEIGFAKRVGTGLLFMDQAAACRRVLNTEAQHDNRISPRAPRNTSRRRRW
jgi:ABC-type polar amino acid transport system ATPase subunit